VHGKNRRGRERGVRGKEAAGRGVGLMKGGHKVVARSAAQKT